MHLVQTLNAAQLCQNVCHSIEKCVQGNFTKKSYLAFLYSLTRRNTPTNYRSQGIRVPGLQPWTKRVETHLQKSFPVIPAKIEAVAKRNDRFPPSLIQVV